MRSVRAGCKTDRFLVCHTCPGLCEQQVQTAWFLIPHIWLIESCAVPLDIPGRLAIKKKGGNMRRKDILKAGQGFVVYEHSKPAN